MACGTPVVGSNCGSVPEIVGEGGICHEPFEADAFIDDLNRFASEPEYRRKFELCALLRAKNFSWKRTAEKTISAYNEVFTKLE
jgi:glycosyltransferase involved in cell wall biosynthesis